MVETRPLKNIVIFIQTIYICICGPGVRFVLPVRDLKGLAINAGGYKDAEKYTQMMPLKIKFIVKIIRYREK